LTACNFGPTADSVQPVEALVRRLAARAPARRWERDAGQTPHEAHALALAIDRARHELGWTPRLGFEDTVAWTDAGYAAPDDLPALVVRQIADYEARRPIAR
jgi:CDP-glucose 4,6-dehydratase